MVKLAVVLGPLSCIYCDTKTNTYFFEERKTKQPLEINSQTLNKINENVFCISSTVIVSNTSFPIMFDVLQLLYSSLLLCFFESHFLHLSIFRISSIIPY